MVMMMKVSLVSLGSTRTCVCACACVRAVLLVASLITQTPVSGSQNGGETVRVCEMCDETNYRRKNFICFRLPTPE
jgi:hypothetical protein